MEQNFETEIKNIVSGKLTDSEIEQLTFFFKQAVTHAIDQDGDEDEFYKAITSEMTGSVRDLALILINFRKDFKMQIRPHIEDIAEKYIPQTADQLEGIIETTEQAANTIMDNLDRMNFLMGEQKKFYSALDKGNIYNSEYSVEEKINANEDILEQLKPFIMKMESNIQENMTLISDTFTQMSFQDLTGQRLQRIISLVSEIEAKITAMMISFGLKLKVKETNPGLSSDELQKMVDDKAQVLEGPQKKGGGLDQCNIDDLLDDLF